VVIVGRPNVGKSSVFNWLLRRRIAIVDATSGVTRDRMCHPLRTDDGYLELVDTGGMGIEDADGLTDQVERQIGTALESASLVLFVVDSKCGIAPLDLRVTELLRRQEKPVLCVANKCDNSVFEAQAAEFHRFGFPLVCVSAAANRGRSELMTAIAERLSTAGAESPAEPELKIAVVGKRNVGKSTFINCLAQTERMIVSEVPGTTRDSVDVHFEHNGKRFVAIDTAGLRRERSISDNVEFYSVRRAHKSIRRADVVLLFLDPTAPISKVDRNLAGYILEHATPFLFVVNKWDLMRPMATGTYEPNIQATFPDLDYVPRVFITAKDSKNVQALVDLAQHLFKQSRERVSTPRLNRMIAKAVKENPPPMKQGRRPKVFYATQAESPRPTIVVFCSDPDEFPQSYKRYLANFLRERLPFCEVPFRINYRSRDTKGRKPRGRGQAASQRRQPPGLAAEFDASDQW
jgi:GTP-binding protein